MQSLRVDNPIQMIKKNSTPIHSFNVNLQVGSSLISHFDSLKANLGGHVAKLCIPKLSQNRLAIVFELFIASYKTKYTSDEKGRARDTKAHVTL